MSGINQLILAGVSVDRPAQETYDFSNFYVDNGLTSSSNVDLSPYPSASVNRQITDIRTNTGKRRNIKNQVVVTYPSYPSNLTASNPRGLYVAQSTSASRKIFSGFATTTNTSILSLITSYNTSPSFNIGEADISSTLESTARLSTGGIFEVIFFSSNGTTLFCTAYDGSRIVNQYSLSSPFNLYSTTFTFVRTYTFSDSGDYIRDLHFSSNGTVMYAATSSGKVIKKTLPSAWNLPSSGSGYDSYASLPTNAYPSQGLWVSDDETIILTAATDGNVTYGIRQSTGTSIGSNNYTLANSFQTSEPPFGLAVDPNNNFVYWHESGSTGEFLVQAPIRLFNYYPSISYLNWAYAIRGFAFKTDGTKIYVVDADTSVIRERSLSTAWDLSTISNTDSATFSTGYAAYSQGFGLTFKPDGTKVYFNLTSGFILERSLSTAWDISSASGSTNFNTGVSSTYTTNLFFNSDGTKMYAGMDDTIYQYNLSTAYDITTASISTTNTFGRHAGFFLSPNGTQLMVISKGSQTKIYKLNNAGLLNSVTIQSGVSVSNEMRENILALSFLQEPISIYGENYLCGIYPKPDMTKVYAVGYGSQGSGFMQLTS